MPGTNSWNFPNAPPPSTQAPLKANQSYYDFGLCPPVLANNPGCKNAPGFDRVAFHKQFNADVLAFFRAQLGNP